MPAEPERHTLYGRADGSCSRTASLLSLHMSVHMIGLSAAIVPPLPSKSTVASLSSSESYSQLSFQMELVPTSMRLSVMYFFQASRASGLV